MSKLTHLDFIAVLLRDMQSPGIPQQSWLGTADKYKKSWLREAEEAIQEWKEYELEQERGCQQ